MGFPGLDKLIERTKNAQAEAETRQLFVGFEYETTKTKWEEYAKWRALRDHSLERMATLGEQYTYEITPTGLGLIVNVRDGSTKDVFCLTDWGLFG